MDASEGHAAASAVTPQGGHKRWVVVFEALHGNRWDLIQARTG